MPPIIQGCKCEIRSRDKKRGGGIAIYIKDKLQQEVVYDLSKVDANIESLCVGVLNTAVFPLYRPPSGNIYEFMTFLENALSFLGSLSVPFFILGDINIGTISDDRHAQNFRDIVNQYACSNLITLPTRITADTATCLDVCITNTDTCHITAGAIMCDISNHRPIFCLESLSARKNSKDIETFWHCTINEESLRTFGWLMEEETWADVYVECNPRNAYKIFLMKVRQYYNAASPPQKRRVK